MTQLQPATGLGAGQTARRGAVDPRSGPHPGPRPRSRPTAGRVLAWTVMVALLVVTMFPFYWMLRTALSSNSALYSESTSLLPAAPSWGGFERVLGLQPTDEAIAQGGSGADLDFWRYLGNSVVVATGITVFQVFFSAMAAYAFSRLRWRGRNVVFGAFLLSLMVPLIFTLLPNFLLVRQLGLVDTLLGIMLPSLFMAPFAIFFLRQFFLNVPVEVEEAALVDGASKVRVFFNLIIPMTAAPIATIAILTYITAWNDYFWPLMVSYTDESRVLTVALGSFRAQTPSTGPDWAGLMAATLIAALPMIVLFACFARRIVNSIGFSGIK
ncbi:carbohydrate ABC transporter permease [Quadrisphaera sp. DSM 44207]|uniref:carbohydrate ABC transporter permease n=1 Tax=Quadrisphaera sp. DSM 44207 TaxID=1881057 RepID=UPI0008858334|nr:carbohydrate ABC transporter permease [Quadrisphaera sp. DSM 44207]SDQ05119.1 multiple sugar transport system permease protein [Quadrisphaera sp. DSM 44207]